MRRLMATCALLLALLLVPATALAQAQGVVPVDITVSVDGGGIVAIESQTADAPAPNRSSLTLRNGEIGIFHIDIDRVGEYVYLVRQVPNGQHSNYDDSTFTVKVYVTNGEDGLDAVVNIYLEGSDMKVDSFSYVSTEGWGSETSGAEISFVNEDNDDDDGGDDDPSKPGGDDPSDGTDDPSKTPGEDGSDSSTTSGSFQAKNPKTGDGGLLERYFLQAMLAAAGLFALSFVYLCNTIRLVRGARRMSGQE